MKVKNIYTSVGCNRSPESADWGENGLIVFAASNSIALMNPQFHGSCKIIKTFVQNSQRITTVKWIKRKSNDEKNEFEIISGSDDGTAIIWNIENIEKPTYHILRKHKSGVNVVDALYVNGILTVATASIDSTIILWNYNEKLQQFENFQTICLKTGFCFVLKMTTLPSTDQILLSYAGDDDHIHLLTEKRNTDGERKFYKILKLIGHTDWVRSIDFIHINNTELFVASGSQDRFVRIWKISKSNEDTNENLKEEKNKILNEEEKNFHNKDKNSEFILDEKGIYDFEDFEKSIPSPCNIDENTFDNPEKSFSRRFFKVVLLENNKVCSYAITLESVLQGHEDWVNSVHWNNNDNNLCLLSSSIDKSLIIWSPNEEDIWMEKVRLGNVGGNILGFIGGKFSSDGKSVFGHSYQGSFHMWKQSESDESMWKPQVISGGHFNDVCDINWEPSGQFLLSVSTDQTTRIHAPWIRFDNKCNDDETTWHEIARPQIHGYDMQCIAMLSRYKFASGAEEKIIRVFNATANFIENFRRICNIKNDPEGDEILESLPKGASVPSLGLSNKAIYSLEETPKHERHVKDEYPENYFVPTELASPPQEEILIQNTLWPEVQKLYGHGFEIFALCSSPDHKFLASSCKAKNIEDAQIIIWDTKTWKQIQKLPSHQYTVTQMKFSPNNQYLLSVSRDRKWTLFEKESSMSETSKKFKIAGKISANGIHTRIIWSCDWSHDSKFFGTTSREGKAVLWHKTNSTAIDPSQNGWEPLGVLKLENESITAIAFAPFLIKNKENEDAYLIALGLENGSILLYEFCENKWNQLLILNAQIAHHLTVRKLQFKPCDTEILLASCGEDNYVRIYEILLL